MTKRFKLIGDSNLEVLMQHQLELPIYDYNNKKKRLSLNTTLNLLNSLYEENEELKQFQEQVAEVIEGKMGDNVCNNYKMQVLEEVWNELKLDKVWFEEAEND